VARLQNDNECPLNCPHYESDANDYYHQWCLHPDIEVECWEENFKVYKHLNYDEYVVKCPLDKWKEKE